MKIAAILVFLGLVAFVSAAQVRDSADPILEWHFTLDCADKLSNTYFTHIEGLSNQNEWECER